MCLSADVNTPNYTFWLCLCLIGLNNLVGQVFSSQPKLDEVAPRKTISTSPGKCPVNSREAELESLRAANAVYVTKSSSS